jgi:Icc-related predicted phosphoesterase
MNILAIADRPPRRSITKTLSENRIDLIVTLGDLEYSEIRELDIVKTIPKLGVYGNHCSGMYFDELGIKNMHLQTFEFGGLTFGGFEGCVRYKESKYAKMYTQEEASALLANFPHVDVMLVHCPPYGINDDLTEIAHTGYKGLLDYVEREEPQYLFHGHTYPNANTLVKKYKNTNIEYVYEDKIIQITF